MKTGIRSVLLLVALVAVVALRGGLPWVTPPLGRFSEVSDGGGEWELLLDCRLIEGRNSDGDSFHVKHEKGEAEFRLYFVDAPESAYRTYRNGETNAGRLSEQGDYFGGLSRNETVALGQRAKDFVLSILAKGDFRILTGWEEVFGPERRYALVIVPWDGGEVYLHELLVFHGLARIHTKWCDLPGGRSGRKQKELLRQWEKEARNAGVGGWKG